MKINNRLNNIQEYHFKRIDELKQELENKGRRIFDFGIGDPDLPVEANIIEELVESVNKPNFNKYPPYDGLFELKTQIIKYYREVFSVQLKLDEVVILIGSKEGLSNIIPAVCDFGDTVLVPVPGYPVYSTCARLWGAEPYFISLNEMNGYLPVLSDIPEEIAQKSKLFIINYPNNPTGAVASENFYNEIKTFCRDNNIVLCNDAAYCEIINLQNKPISILKGGKEDCIEFGTFSKTFNMTGFRIGYAAGDAGIIKALLKIKTNVDSGQFIPVQYAAVRALKIDRSSIEVYRRIYDERRAVMEDLLIQKGISFFKSAGTFYVWCRVPHGYTTDSFCEEMLNDYGIILTPGYTFGNLASGYFRIALTRGVCEIEEAFSKIKVYN